MPSWSTVLRDLALTAVRAAARRSRPRTGSGDADLRIPDLATVEETRRAQHEADRDPHDHDAPADSPPPRPTADPARDQRRLARDDDGVTSAGQVGPGATVEVDPRTLDLVATSYNPDTDGDPDPGEIVWTWVPYEEADGRGKDRPVVVVARIHDEAVLAVQLSSRDHDGDRGWAGLGAGNWDGEHRPSWANLDRVLLVRPDGMRREAAVLERERFDRLTAALQRHHRWPS